MIEKQKKWNRLDDKRKVSCYSVNYQSLAGYFPLSHRVRFKNKKESMFLMCIGVKCEQHLHQTGSSMFHEYHKIGETVVHNRS